jgi:hypothetical protein
MWSASATPIASRTKVNIPDPQEKLQRRIDTVTETAKKLSEVSVSVRQARSDSLPTLAARVVAERGETSQWSP